MAHGNVALQKEVRESVRHDTAAAGFCVVSSHSRWRTLCPRIWASIRGQSRYEEFKTCDRRCGQYKTGLRLPNRNPAFVDTARAANLSALMFTPNNAAAFAS